MKRFSACLILFFFLAISFYANANRVVVVGHVRYANGTPAMFHRVTIATDTMSNSAMCQIVHQKYTDSSGRYSDTLECSSNITKLRIYTENCDGTVLINDPAVPASNTVESNFTLCNLVIPPVNCVSQFTWTRVANTYTINFNSSMSAGTTPADTIRRRRWTFSTGGDTLGGNVVSPSHTYSQRGSYQVCLTIWTIAGCEKTFCQTANIADSIVTPTTCVASFTSQRTPNTLTVNFNSSLSSGTSATDSIRRRRWNFGNGDTLGGNIVSPSYTYAQKGTYAVCLTIWTKLGCEKTYCQNVTLSDSIVSPTSCVSSFTSQRVANTLTINFNSASSSGTSATDSIRRRRWNFGNGDTLGGNIVSPAHTYTQRGTYQVCLTIWTTAGCEKSYCQTITLTDSSAVRCYSRFTYTAVPASSSVPAFTLRFNSSTSEAAAGDSIKERIWSFGDGTSLTGNVSDPSHTYAHDGLYTACLTIRTYAGCQTQECRQVVVTANGSQCAPQFTYERIAPKKVRFNSSMSYVPASDSIIERSWNFGDGSVLGGNVVAPVKEYLNLGIYNVCLKIRTARGCENTYCNIVRVQDSVVTPTTDENISIVSVSPNPATTQLQTVVWSRQNNISAELAVYDIYGVKKWSINKSLLQGNNVTVVPTGLLLSGPYFFRVTTMYGVKAKQFYKL